MDHRDLRRSKDNLSFHKEPVAVAVTVYPNPNKYWDFLSETLHVVFGRSDAAELVVELRCEVEKARPEEQALFFHAEPLDVAMALTGSKSAKRFLSKYLALVKQQNWFV